MSLIKITSRDTGIHYWVNPLQITDICGEGSILHSRIWSVVHLSSGKRINTNVDPDELVTLVNKSLCEFSHPLVEVASESR